VTTRELQALGDWPHVLCTSFRARTSHRLGVLESDVLFAFQPALLVVSHRVGPAHHAASLHAERLLRGFVR